MHPGPVNRGIELSAEVIDGPSSLIAAVPSGLVVRMAIIYELLRAGAVVTSVETALFELVGRAGTDEFRQVQKLVLDFAPNP